MNTPDDALLCPITLELFRDPVVAQDGHTYERKAIEEWIQKNGTSPITSQQISTEHLVPNYTVKKMVDQFETSIRDKNFQYTLDVDVKKKKGRPLFQTFGKTIYHAEWLPTNDGRPEIILLKIDGARANKEASFYVDLSRHPHIVRTFGLVREEDDDIRNSVTLLQEYAPEGSLYELLTERKKPLDEKVLIEIFSQIIDAMSYLALNNVVHGDLACRNVLVFRFDEKDPRNIVVKITDFGLSRYSKIYSQVATVARTTLNIIPKRYCAPEILAANITANDYTEKSDVYSMGVLMWEAYSQGTIPWKDIENEDDVVQLVRNGDILPQPANCSPHVWNILTETWGKFPNQRPTFDQLKNLFKDQLYQTPTLPPKPSLSSSKLSSNNIPLFYQHCSADAATPNNQYATDMNSKHNHMLGKTVRFGKDSYEIMAYIPCKNKHLFALQCERSMILYDGVCPECNGEHIKLANSRGFYATVDSIYEALEQQKLEKERLQGRKEIVSLPKIANNLPPLDHPILGINKGIEGDSNSCYMDATIYCMFTYSNVFDALLYQNVDKKQSMKLQQLLRENIVHILRSETGFVERDALFYLRAQLSEATGDQSFKEMEKDPSEFLRALEELFHFAPLKTIPPNQPPNATKSNIATNIIWEMLDTNPQKPRATNIASIFRNSLSEVPAKLATIPPFLVLVAPRHARSQRSYHYIIPDRQITLDNNIVQLVCLKCNKTNHDPATSRDFYSCDGCYSEESSLTTSTINATVAFYCASCIATLHTWLRKELPTHQTKRIEINKHKLNLFAVLCIEVCHSVAFVKCQNRSQQEHEWLFFDSMSDRIHNEKNVPRVDRVPDFDKWIDQAERDKSFFKNLDKRRNRGGPTSQTFNENEMRQLRLFRDGAFFFYENISESYQ